MRQLLCEPSLHSSKRRNIVNILAHYARLDCEGDSQYSTRSITIRPGAEISVANNILALEFLKLSCQVWQTHSTHKRIDLKLLLTKD